MEKFILITEIFIDLIKIVTFALFSEAEGISILNALAKGGAKLSTHEQVRPRESKQHSTLDRKTRVQQKKCKNKKGVIIKKKSLIKKIL